MIHFRKWIFSFTHGDSHHIDLILVSMEYISKTLLPSIEVLFFSSSDNNTAVRRMNMLWTL